MKEIFYSANIRTGQNNINEREFDSHNEFQKSAERAAGEGGGISTGVTCASVPFISLRHGGRAQDEAGNKQSNVCAGRNNEKSRC